MLNEHETNLLKVLLADYGAKGVVDALATVMQQGSNESQGATSAILNHDAYKLRNLVPHLWSDGDRRRVDLPRPGEWVETDNLIDIPAFFRRALR